MQWNDYDVYISGFLHWLCTNSRKNIGYASLIECTLTILQMVNTRRGAESSQQGAENNPPPPPQTLAEVVAQQTQILQMLVQNQVQQQSQSHGRQGQPQMSS